MMTEYGAAQGGIDGQQQVDARPEGLTEKQDAVIQHVANYVVNSCDSAQYQHKVRSKTRHNAYFAFLDPQHPYHNYYEYLLQSYRYWKGVEAAAGEVGTTIGMFSPADQQDEAYVYYQEQMQRDQQQFTAGGDLGYAHQWAGGNSGIVAPGAPFADPTAVMTGEYYNAGGGNVNASSVGNSALAPSILSVPSAVDHPALNTVQEDEDDDDGVDYEFVMENGVQKLLPKKR